MATNDLVQALSFGRSGNGYYGIDPNTGVLRPDERQTKIAVHTVILADGSNFGGPEFGSGNGDPDGNDTTFVVKSLGAGTRQ